MHIPQRPTDRSILGWSDQGASGLERAATALRRTLQIGHWPLPPGDLPSGTALVGGAVRDGLLGRLGARPDLDLVVPGDAVALCQELGRRHGGTAVVLDGRRSIARLVLNGWCLDLARQVGDSLEEDLWRRDFRLNALALPLAPSAPLQDPTGGLPDLALGRVVAVGEANLRDDPLRLLRGIRLATELEFELAEETSRWIGEHHLLISAVAPERVLAELDKLATCPMGHLGLAIAVEKRLLEPWRWSLGPAAEAGPAAAFIGETLRDLEGLTRERAASLGLAGSEAACALGIARLAVLFDGAGVRRLHGSRQLQQRCGRLHHWWKHLIAAGEGVEDRLAALAETERLSLHQQLAGDLPALLLFFPNPLAAAWMRRWRVSSDPLFHPHPPMDGRRLQQAFGLVPSPQLGLLLAHLTREQAFGRITKPEEALKVARIWLNGTTP
jgi:tRNA nucleotidyltransferase (CCA-adding enzyme)